MSTKAVRKALEAMRDMRDSDVTGEYYRLATDGLRAWETIERAAKDACRGSVTHRLLATDGGIELALMLESIANEASGRDGKEGA